MNHINIDDIADYLKLERSYFSNFFKQKVVISPKKYLTKYRMKTAADLMIKKGISVAVAGNSVGYTDSFAFSKIFKKHFGVSPAIYKKQFCKNNEQKRGSQKM